MTTLAEARALGTPLVERTVRKTVPCRVCERPLVRSTVLREVQDKTARRPKTIETICAEMRYKAARWYPENDICAACVKGAEAEPEQKASTPE
jgi:hypothetical protein